MSYFTEYEEMLILKSQITIRQFIEIHGEEKVKLSFSGGKDSTALKHLIYSVNKNISSIFCNTGVEYNSIVDFIKNQHSETQIIKPKKTFFQVIDKYGYPAISKEQSRYLYDVRNPNTSKKTLDIRLGNGNFKISKKWRWILNTNIKLSHKCCYFLKEYPLIRLGYFYFTGERVEESNLRKQKYHTCILKNKCIPLRLWSSELIDKYIKYHNIKICDIYEFERRTGCKYCLYGIHFEKGQDRIDRLKFIEPKSYNMLKNRGIIDLKNKIKNGNKK